ncbi:hypothetical protein [Sporohalobacter salinus]|uniref:hypothetical protein n=1 Tax=Sporohalobacter salinus TaxID=1494606 RepID=UPI00195FE933|nr:hypothetical protein [Sporohalobacter salinus]
MKICESSTLSIYLSIVGGHFLLSLLPTRRKIRSKNLKIISTEKAKFQLGGVQRIEH